MRSAADDVGSDDAPGWPDQKEGLQYQALGRQGIYQVL
jgi:hypothetical protein